MVKKIAITATFLSVFIIPYPKNARILAEYTKVKLLFCAKKRGFCALSFGFYNVLCMAVTSAASMISHQLLPGLYSALLEEI